MQQQIRSHYDYNNTVPSTVSQLINKPSSSPFYQFVCTKQSRDIRYLFNIVMIGLFNRFCYLLTRISRTTLQACRRELEFLVEVDRHRALASNGAVIRRAIRRYEQCWLPLAAEHGKRNDVAPPLDVHWVWHCHMLSPYKYESDLIRLAGAVVDHRLMSTSELENARKRAKSLWTAAFPQEPFDVNLDSAGDSDISETSYMSQCNYDLAAAIERQAKFYYQVLQHRTVCTTLS